MIDPRRPLEVAVVIVFDLEEIGAGWGALRPGDAIESVWTFSSRVVADVWIERRADQNPTLGYATFDVPIDAGISELPTREG